jgi:hypothetical protein
MHFDEELCTLDLNPFCLLTPARRCVENFSRGKHQIIDMTYIRLIQNKRTAYAPQDLHFV